MAWSISDLFPTWGDSGEQPAENFQYDGEDQVNEKHFDYLWDSLYTLEDQIRSALTDIDSDADGTVDEADSALLYKDNDIDSDGDGTVDEADYANDADASTYKGNDLDSDGDGTVDEADSALLYKDNDIDTDGDGTVDAADYANDADASTYKGNDLDSDGDGVVNEADDTTTVKGNDIDTDGDGTVDAADNASQLGGQSASDFADDPHGNEAHTAEATVKTTTNYTFTDSWSSTGDRNDGEILQTIDIGGRVERGWISLTISGPTTNTTTLTVTARVLYDDGSESVLCSASRSNGSQGTSTDSDTYPSSPKSAYTANPTQIEIQYTQEFDNDVNVSVEVDFIAEVTE